MRKEICTCDFCEKDLWDAGPSGMNRLCVFEEKIPSNSTVSYGIYWEPMIPNTLHFCGLGCLSKWLENKKSKELR